VKWRSVEHCYQAAKYEDASIVKIIHSASSPLAARKAGQNRSLTPRQDWDENKIRVMTEAVRAKFTQNRRLREQLLATGDEELVHLSRNDLFWGRTAEGGGENRLGLILMEVRSELRRQDG
ncbi:MAG TPA: NADAR family protein, partial [Prosthecobacter sp.]|nr:NADAR family protein [Prosthecobacter sp.]